MDAAPHNIQTEHFEVDQYVRVQLSNGRSEIGVVVEIDEPGGVVVVATRHGYEITVRPSNVRRAFLLVLDLNGVLVARGRGSFIDRPGVEEFISFVMNNFVVAVWTSGLERTSNPIIEKVFDGYQDRLLFKLYRDACTVVPTDDKPYRTIKNLQRIFDAYPKSFHAVNTIIVDDSPDKCSHPDIALCPVPFNDPERQLNDDGLALATEVLREVLRVESNAPLINASEERLLALAVRENAGARKKRPGGANSSGLPETLLWTTRLCCDHISGRCSSDGCRFSHDADDGKRPCSQKSSCLRGHAHRWKDDPSVNAETAPALSTSSNDVGAPPSFDVSNIISSLLNNTEKQKQSRRDDNPRDAARSQQRWGQIKRQLQQQEVLQERERQQREQQQQEEEKKQLRQHSRAEQRKQQRRGNVGKKEEIRQDRKAAAKERQSAVHVTSSGVHSSGMGHVTLQDSSAVNSIKPKGISMRLSGDRQDGFALLRQLQAGLSQYMEEEKGMKNNGNRIKRT